MKPFQVTGKLIAQSDDLRITDSFIKREIIVDIGSDQYPNEVFFEITGENRDIAEPYADGEIVDVQFYIKGQKRKFINLRCVGIQSHVRAKQAPATTNDATMDYRDEEIPTGRTHASEPDQPEQVPFMTDDLPF